MCVHLTENVAFKTVETTDGLIVLFYIFIYIEIF